MPSLLCLVLIQLTRAAPGDSPVPAVLQPDPTDRILPALVAETLAHSPDHARARADVDAERQRVPQAGALPDPTLVLGIQNDGFNGIQIGVMPTSFWQVLMNVPLSWPGKRGLREDVAEAQLGVTEAALQRVRLTLLGEVERAYLDLRLVRGQLALQERLESLWKQAEEMARARYQVGEVPQSDLLRAQLERTRLRLQRLALEAARAGGASRRSTGSASIRSTRPSTPRSPWSMSASAPCPAWTSCWPTPRPAAPTWRSRPGAPGWRRRG